MKYTRRNFPMLLSALAAAPAAVEAAGDEKMLTTKIFQYDQLPVKTSGQNHSRAAFEGLTHSGFHVGMHMTELAPGTMPHAAHHHSHEEMLLLHRGTLEITYGDGKKERFSAPSSVWVGSNVEHGWKNVGTESAEYFIVELGKGQG